MRSLGELDSALYLRENGEEQLQIVADAVLSHVRRLLEFLGMVAASANADGEAGSGDGAEIAPSRRKSDDERWRALAGEMDSLQYGLGSEIREFDRRFSVALKNDRKEQALRDLNDATTSLMDGVFAVMTTVYECFLGYAEPERMIPGHRDTLGKALAVRRGLAELRREVKELNRSIQDRESLPIVVETSYKLMVESLAGFMEEDVYHYLRSDDRKEFEQFRELLSQGDAARNRRACEGFDKYLDSLAFVSKREVLIRHDNELRAKIGDELDRALAYAERFPELVCEAIHQAFVKGDRLFGLNDQLDLLVYRWFALTDDKRADVAEAVPMARLLRELVQPAAAPQPPGGGDFL